MNTKTDEITELDAKIKASELKSTPALLIMLGLIVILAIAVFPSSDYLTNLVLNITIAILFVLAVMIMGMDIISKKDYLKFLNMMHWPRKYVLKDK